MQAFSYMAAKHAILTTAILTAGQGIAICNPSKWIIIQLQKDTYTCERHHDHDKLQYHLENCLWYVFKRYYENRIKRLLIYPANFLENRFNSN